MNNKKLIEVFATALAIDAERINAELTYNSIPEWDSTSHMILIAEIETQFDVMLDTDDIIEMNSVAKAESILAKYLG
ncbi:acyl carrier protein [Shewanella baltica]|uniref:acyl carrier protein n=1 Tax=Shewanella baltica TaxID=62322 RepID=UPI0024B8D596|nr:acyl carrier protein [Shewanella baltica]